VVAPEHVGDVVGLGGLRLTRKNEIHAVPWRRVHSKPPCSDLFEVKGRRWLASLELRLEERDSVDARI
jgi:hypothetical protein